MTATPLCIHHHPCADGFSAAWAVWKAFAGEVNFWPGVHGEPPPDVTGRHVIIVDFSYPKEILLRMVDEAASMLVLDHHKTAQEALVGLPPAAPTWKEHIADAERYADASGLNRLGVQFDMEHSGCILAWNYFHPADKPPAFLLHMEDRDLWRFKLPHTREITAATFSYDYIFQVWSKLAFWCEDADDKARLIAEGSAILRQHDKDIAELLPQTKRRMVIGGYTVWVANLPYQMASDAAGIMAEDKPFAATYWDGPVFRNFSLRSRREAGVDVGEIAKQYGGGGHRNASGFRVRLCDLYALNVL